MPEHTRVTNRACTGERVERTSGDGEDRTQSAAAIRDRRARNRWLVHLGMMVTVVVSLVFEPVLTIHIIVGLAFVTLVLVHVTQRRFTSAKLAARLLRIRTVTLPANRLAIADALLAAISLAMLVSGFWASSLATPPQSAGMRLPGSYFWCSWRSMP